MPIIVFASELIVTLLHRLPWLLYAGAAILTHTAARLLLEDPLVRPLYPHTPAFAWGGTVLTLAGVLGLAYWRNRRSEASPRDANPDGSTHPPVGSAPRTDPVPMVSTSRTTSGLQA